MSITGECVSKAFLKFVFGISTIQSVSNPVPTGMLVQLVVENVGLSTDIQLRLLLPVASKETILVLAPLVMEKYFKSLLDTLTDVSAVLAFKLRFTNAFPERSIPVAEVKNSKPVISVIPWELRSKDPEKAPASMFAGRGRLANTETVTLGIKPVVNCYLT